MELEMRVMRKPLNALQGYVHTLMGNEVHGELLDDERYDLILKEDRQLTKLVKYVDAMSDLACYSLVSQLKFTNKVLVNEFCRQLAGEQDVNVRFVTDIPDYYAIKTHYECLCKVLTVLLGHAAERVMEYYPTHPETEPEIVLKVSEKVERNKLTFLVSDSGCPTTVEEDLRTFDLPTGDDQVSDSFIFRQVELFNVKLMVNLLGGFIYVDPKFPDGRRVIFSIALQP